MERANESVLEQLFAQFGTKTRVEANQPILVSDERYVWLVVSGHVDVFSVSLVAGEISNQRRFMFGVDVGQVLFGYHEDGLDASDGLLASGLSGTEIIRMEVYHLREAGADHLFQPIIAHAVGEWIHRWSFALRTSNPAVGGASIWSAFDTVGWMNVDPNWHALSEFHRFARQRIAQIHQWDQLDEVSRLERKAENDRLAMEQAIKRLASVNEKSKGRTIAATASDVPLFLACRTVGETIGIVMKMTDGNHLQKSRDPISDIANASNVRSRQVVLKDNWWQTDNGPLVAFIEVENKPIALIPKNPSTYYLVDPVNGSEQIVTESIARTLSPLAHMFYRPFPSRPLSVMDIVKLGDHQSLKKDVVMMILMGVVGGILGMFIPIANGILFDKIIPNSNRGLLLQMAMILLSVTVTMFLFGLTRSMAMLRIEGKMDSAIQAAVWDRLLNLPVSFFRNYSSGDLAIRANSINAIRQMISGVAITAIFSGVFSSFNFFLLFYYDVRMALMAAVLVLISILVTVGIGILQVRRQRVLLQIQGKISGTVLQFINGITKFRMAAAEKRAFFLWAKMFGELKETSFKSRSLSNIHAVFNSIFPIITSMVLFYMVVSGAGISSAGQFIAFFAAFSSFLMAMISMSTAFITIINIVPLYERAKPILQTVPEIHEALENPGELSGSIEIKHVHFSYSPELPNVLNDLSIHIRAGEFVALVGSSGCGKSTLLRLLLGFEKPGSGSIYYDGLDLKALDIRSVRGQLGVVLQNGKIMSGDIFSNIIGSSMLTIEDAWEAARMAGFDEDVRQMPMGMHTVISEGGSTLSGGQRQRLLIARAMARRPKIILFDEATSALDNRTQAIVSESLEKLHATRVVIAHRLSTIMNADRIFVLDKGRVVQSGSFVELMNQDGLFNELAQRQLA